MISIYVLKVIAFILDADQKWLNKPMMQWTVFIYY